MTTIRPCAIVHVPAAPMFIDVVAGGGRGFVSVPRARAIRAIADVLEDRAAAGTPVTDVVLVAHRTGRHSTPAGTGMTGWGRFDLAPIGVPHSVGDPAQPPLTTAAQIELAVGADLLAAALDQLPRAVPAPTLLAIDLTGRDAQALAAVPDGAMVIAIGDAGAARDEKAPGYIVDGAVEYDDALIRAIEAGDLSWLAANPPDDEYLVGGYPAWRLLAEVLPAPTASEVHHVSAPLGVCYVVATWRFA